MSIADQLELHAQQELKHALIISRQIDYLGKMPTVSPKSVHTSEKARDMLRFDLENETETIRNYRERVRQCESLGDLPWLNRFGRSSSRSRIIKSIWRRRSGKTFRM
jgi:bacterioferritin